MSEKLAKNNVEDDCDKPEIKITFKDGKCSRDQVLKCHGKERVIELEQEGKFD